MKKLPDLHARFQDYHERSKRTPGVEERERSLPAYRSLAQLLGELGFEATVVEAEIARQERLRQGLANRVDFQAAAANLGYDNAHATRLWNGMYKCWFKYQCSQAIIDQGITGKLLLIARRSISRWGDTAIRFRASESNEDIRANNALLVVESLGESLAADDGLQLPGVNLTSACLLMDFVAEFNRERLANAP